MKIVDFVYAHLEQAMQITKQNYQQERSHVPALPLVETFPDLTPYAGNGLGVAAFAGEEMLGFLCCVLPFKNAFRSTEAVGIFSPMGANGAVGENRAEVYARMYQAAGEKWAEAGATSHSICLYAHDKEAQEQFFKYGFGMRCVDAVRAMDEISAPNCESYTFKELAPEEFPQILPLNMDLVTHLEMSPSFMKYPHISQSFILENLQCDTARYFVAKQLEKIIAYLKIEDEGETFACDASDMMNISGAFCLPNHRGKGVFDSLLNYTIGVLRQEGYMRLGVDFESFNPNAYGFWKKYFEAYTHSVVLRIDEYSVKHHII